MFKSIKRLFKWIPIIWKDRDYDYCFILKILYHKIYFTRKYTEKYGIHVDADKDLKNMMIAEELLNRLIKCNYLDYLDGKAYTLQNFEHEEYLIKQDIDFLFNLLKKQINKWWV